MIRVNRLIAGGSKRRSDWGTLRALTPVSALNARLLRPDIEPDSSLGIADTDTYITAKADG